MKKLISTSAAVLSLIILFSSFSVFAYDFDLDGYQLDSKAAYVVNTDTGRVVFNNGADEKRSIASLTKIMTAVCVLENCGDLQEKVTAKQEELSAIGKTGLVTVGLRAGEKMSVENLLYCLLLPSAADAALVLADHVGGSVEGFVSMMNEKAASLGMENTHYVDPHGLHDIAQDHYSTARDQARLCEYAMKNKVFSKIVSTPEYIVPATNYLGQRKLESTNSLLIEDNSCSYESAKGIKTGYTKDAGRCLASAASNGSENYICVVLGCVTHQTNGKPAVRHFMDSIYLFEDAFKNYSLKTAFNENDVMTTVPDKCFGIKEDVRLVPEKEFRWLLKNGEEFSTELSLLQEKLSAPVEKGEKLGECRILVGGTEVGTVDLVAEEDVERSVGRMIFTVLLIILIAAAVIFAAMYVFSAASQKKNRNTRRTRR